MVELEDEPDPPVAELRQRLVVQGEHIVPIKVHGPAGRAIQTFYTLPGDVYYLSRIPVNIKIMDVVTVAVSAITITFLATIHPCRQAARLDPAEALRYE